MERTRALWNAVKRHPPVPFDGDERLDGVALRRRLALAAQDRAACRVLGIAKGPEPALQRLVEPEGWHKCPSAPATWR